jgi:large subunit ribosomal protein L25
MIQTITWKAAKRGKISAGDMKTKRAEGLIPASISKRGEESISVFIAESDIRNKPFGNFRLALEIEGENAPVDCYLKELQYNYSSDKVIHADLQGLTAGQELDIDVSFEIIGDAPGVKAGGILNMSISSVKIRTLPKNIPGSIQVDVSKLQLGDSIGVQDIKFAKEHTLIEPLEGTIVSVYELRRAEADETPGEITEPKIIGEKSE